MSVCIVAGFPWQAIRALGIEGPPCAFVFTDCRVINRYGPIGRVRLAKQRVFSDNLVVCYTSTDVFVTTRALDGIEGAPTTSGRGSISTERDVRRIGEFLKKEHTTYGGFTELIAIVWQKSYPFPQIIAVMPPAYDPKPQHGGVGIGDDQVLRRFKEVLRNPPPGVLQVLESGALLKRYPKLSERLPPGVTLATPSCEGPAETEIGVALSQAIEEIVSPTVGYPLEINRVTKQGIISRGMSVRRKATGSWEKLTPGPGELSLPSNPPQRSDRPKGRRKALQLFP